MGTRSDYYIRYADGHITYVCSHSHNGYRFWDLIAPWIRDKRRKKTPMSFARAVANMHGEMGDLYFTWPWRWRLNPEYTDRSYLFDETSKRVLAYRIAEKLCYDLEEYEADREECPPPVLRISPRPTLTLLWKMISSLILS